MAKKKCQKLIVPAIVGIILAGLMLFFRLNGEKTVAAALFVAFIVVFFRLVRRLRGWLEYNEFMALWERQVEKDVGHYAVCLTDNCKIFLWMDYAPEEEIKQFCNGFKAMLENDFGYVEAKNIVEQIKKYQK